MDFIYFLVIAGSIFFYLRIQNNATGKDKKGKKKAKPMVAGGFSGKAAGAAQAAPVRCEVKRKKAVASALRPAADVRQSGQSPVSGTLSVPSAENNASAREHAHKTAEEDFTIRSAEEARRAIVWGEILRRKY